MTKQGISLEIRITKRKVLFPMAYIYEKERKKIIKREEIVERTV